MKGKDNHVVHTHANHPSPKEFLTLQRDVYIVSSYPTKNMTLTSTDAVPKNFSKWNRTPKGSSNFGNVRVYLFVDTLVAVVYVVLSSSTKSTTLASTDTGSQKSFKK